MVQKKKTSTKADTKASTKSKKKPKTSNNKTSSSKKKSAAKKTSTVKKTTTTAPKANNKNVINNKSKKVANKTKTLKSSIVLGVIIGLIGIIGLGFIFRFVFTPAATVNGIIISEAEICTAVQDIRVANKAESDEDFASFMRGTNLTIEDFRDKVIDSVIEDKLFDQLCSQYNVAVSDSEINDTYNNMKNSFNTTYSEQGVTFEQALEQQKTTVTQYKESIRISLLAEKLVYAATDAGACDEYAENYYVELDKEQQLNGMRIFYPLVFATEDEAITYRDQLLNNETTIEELASTLAENDYNNANGDIPQICSKETTPEEYINIINSLDKKEMTIVRENQDSGYFYLFYATDIVNCTEPFIGWSNLVNQDIKATMVHACVAGNEACLDWLIEQTKNNSDITKYDMPWGLPYDIDINLGKEY